jgi:hypothetical protein
MEDLQQREQTLPLRRHNQNTATAAATATPHNKPHKKTW